MKRKTKKKPETNNIKIAFIFFILVFFLIIVSLLFKLTILIQNSKFDGKHSFILVLNGTKDKANQKQLINFAPDKSSISILDVGSKENNIGKFLEVPIDGNIRILKNESNSLLREGSNKNIEGLISTAVFGKDSYNDNLTILDKIRLLIFAKSIQQHNILYKQISDQDNLSEEMMDKISNQFFSDSLITEEKVSIQIINGTGVSGLGNRLSRLISNIGGNVISVSSSDQEFNTSEISYSTDSYTLQRISKILKFNTSKIKENAISDITIKIGKDNIENLVF